MPETNRGGSDADRQRAAETVLKKMGYARVPRAARDPEVEPAFWVQESGVPRRTFPVFFPAERSGPSALIERWVAGPPSGRTAPRRAILVVPSDRDADETWARIARSPGAGIESEVSFLVVPTGERAEPAGAHFHLRVADPREVLRLATGIVVGLFRRAQAAEGSSEIDFQELLQLLRRQFRVDLHASLGVDSDEAALFMLYQMARKYGFAPGDPSANLHLLVLRPTGPAARLPWFAA
jgi:hypothetical protein